MNLTSPNCTFMLWAWKTYLITRLYDIWIWQELTLSELLTDELLRYSFFLLPEIDILCSLSTQKCTWFVFIHSTSGWLGACLLPIHYPNQWWLVNWPSVINLNEIRIKLWLVLSGKCIVKRYLPWFAFHIQASVDKLTWLGLVICFPNYLKHTRYSIA